MNPPRAILRSCPLVSVVDRFPALLVATTWPAHYGLETASASRLLLNPVCQTRIGVDLGGGLPLPEQLYNRSEIVDQGEPEQDPCELDHDKVTIVTRQEHHPRAHFVDRDLQPLAGLCARRFRSSRASV